MSVNMFLHRMCLSLGTPFPFNDLHIFFSRNCVFSCPSGKSLEPIGYSMPSICKFSIKQHSKNMNSFKDFKLGGETSMSKYITSIHGDILNLIIINRSSDYIIFERNLEYIKFHINAYNLDSL